MNIFSDYLSFDLLKIFSFSKIQFWRRKYKQYEQTLSTVATSSLKTILEIYIKAFTVIYFIDIFPRSKIEATLPGTRIISSDPPRREGLNYNRRRVNYRASRARSQIASEGIPRIRNRRLLDEYRARDLP